MQYDVALENKREFLKNCHAMHLQARALYSVVINIVVVVNINGTFRDYRDHVINRYLESSIAIGNHPRFVYDNIQAVKWVVVINGHWILCTVKGYHVHTSVLHGYCKTTCFL